MDDKQIRQAVLEAMNAHRKKAKHEVQIRMHSTEVRRAVKRLGLELSESQIMQALDYLTGSKLIKQTKETQTIRTLSTGRSSYNSIAPRSTKHEVYWYTLTVAAIDKLDGETEYSKPAFKPYQNIHITTSNAPVIVGSNNTVSNNVTLFNQIEELQQIIADSQEVEVDERRDAVGDIESLKQQLVKPNPNHSVVSSLWTSIARVADLAGAGGLIAQVASAIGTATGINLS